MKNHSDDFVRIDNRKWNDFLAYGDIKGKTLEWKINWLQIWYAICRLHRKMWYAFREKILYQRIPTPRSAPKMVLKDAWQVEQGTLSSSGGRHQFKIDLKFRNSKEFHQMQYLSVKEE